MQGNYEKAESACRVEESVSGVVLVLLRVN